MRLCHGKCYVIGNGENYLARSLNFVTNYQIPSEFLKKKRMGRNVARMGKTIERETSREDE
jgi:hypothetical protein